MTKLARPRSGPAHLLAAACSTALLLAPLSLPAADSSPSAQPGESPRPRVGLVLAGGGAKGGAHVGVIKVLEEMRIPVNCIAGTSMGALVGGGYAIGLSAAELDSFVRGIDWKAVVGGAGRRPLEPIEQKRESGTGPSGLDLGITRERKIVTAAGLVDTSSIDDLLRRYVASARNVSHFDQLPIPFRAVATDMLQGQMVVLDNGDLATALRASMAIPGAFSPVVTADHILADGGMVRNIPIDIARQTCADVVIVVNLETPVIRRENLVSATQMLGRSMDVMIVANELAQLSTLTADDVLIAVQMGDIGTADFERTADAIDLGEAAARMAAPQLAKLAVSAPDYLAWRQQMQVRSAVESRLAGIRFEGLDWVNPDYLVTITTLRPGDPATLDSIALDSQRISALDEIESAAYTLEGSAEAPVLVWQPVEASVGRDVLRPSLGVGADGGGDFKFQADVSYTRRWLNSRGGEWRNLLQLGYESALQTSLYQPFDVRQTWFAEPGAFARRQQEDVYSDGDRIADYSISDFGGFIDIGRNFGRTTQMRAGYVLEERRSRTEVGLPLLPDLDARDAYVAISLLHDTRNASSNASGGLATLVEYKDARDSLGGERSWRTLEAGLRVALPTPRRKDVFWFGVAGGTDFGEDLPADRAFSLGGANTLPSHSIDELRVQEYWLVSASFLWHLVDLVPVKNQGLYFGLGLQAAGLHGRLDGIPDDEKYSISTYLSGSTPLGPLRLGAGFSQDDTSIWLSLGMPIGSGSIMDSALLR